VVVECKSVNSGPWSIGLEESLSVRADESGNGNIDEVSVMDEGCVRSREESIAKWGFIHSIAHLSASNTL
jgi:hypothetical protein